MTEQIDALEATAVDSFKYLVVTRMVACVVALPILTTVMNASGIVGGYLAEATLVQTSPQLYFNRAFSLMDFTDLIPATLKTAVFGFVIRRRLVLPRDDHNTREPKASAAPRPAASSCRR